MELSKDGQETNNEGWAINSFFFWFSSKWIDIYIILQILNCIHSHEEKVNWHKVHFFSDEIDFLNVHESCIFKDECKRFKKILQDFITFSVWIFFFIVVILSLLFLQLLLFLFNSSLFIRIDIKLSLQFLSKTFLFPCLLLNFFLLYFFCNHF